jgi:putative CocE/NonD family hydrolase
MIVRDRTNRYISNFNNTYNNTDSGKITKDVAQKIVNKYFFKTIFSLTRAIVSDEIQEDHKRRYVVNDSILISMKDGAEISVVVVQRKGQKKQLPALLNFSIYAEKNNLWSMLSASKGYIGVMANTRGKRLSKSEITPFRHENTDVYEVIDWISKQSWSNQKVGMYGGSYDGFTQWASMKHKVHPALKTIIPSVSIAPGIDYPMENNVLYNISYSWSFMVTNNKYLDYDASGDFQRWNNLKKNWYSSGAAFNKLDSIDGEVNKMFSDYIKHPSYDDYWKNMIPYKKEFTKIDIPILSITGYYDDAQRGAIYYYNQHLKYNKNANHYLLLGPYDHWTAQDRPYSHLRGYKLDDVALLDIRYEVSFQWFDYILKGKEKPAILKDKVNFQVMGENKWIHKPNLTAMTNDKLVFQLSDEKESDFYKLKTESTKQDASLKLVIDFANRENTNNADYYPWPLEKDSINLKDGLVFRSEPLEKTTIMNGSFGGDLFVSSNKKDFDFSVVLYELTPENKYFHLSYYIGRASYAENREQRKLLEPNKLTRIQFSNSKIISKKLAKGSRIVAVINVNKNSFTQINYGTGKDVNTESIHDATVPLELKINSKTKLFIPILNKK